MEYIDSVNEKDKVIGITSKEKSHTKGIIHRVVSVFAFTPDKRLYVQVHNKSGGLFDHSVGGHVKKGESYDLAANREAYEELQLTGPLEKVLTFYSDERFSGSNIRHMFAIYECVVSPEWKFMGNQEVEKIILLPLEEIIDIMNTEPRKFTAGFINTMKEYVKIKKLKIKINKTSK